jgi:hypothetical protein
LKENGDTMDIIDDYTDEDRLIDYYDRKIYRINKLKMEKQKEIDNKKKEIESSCLEIKNLKKKNNLVDYKNRIVRY